MSIAILFYPLHDFIKNDTINVGTSTDSQYLWFEMNF